MKHLEIKFVISQEYRKTKLTKFVQISTLVVLFIQRQILVARLELRAALVRQESI